MFDPPKNGVNELETRRKMGLDALFCLVRLITTGRVHVDMFLTEEPHRAIHYHRFFRFMLEENGLN